MKRIVLTVFLSGLLTLAMAQSLSISNKNVMVEGPNAGYKDAECTITNISSDAADTSFTWTILEINTPGAWALSMCDPKDCYIGLNIGMNRSFNLKQTGSGPIKATFDFMSTQGSGNIKMVLSSVKTPQNADTLNFTGTAWTTGLAETIRKKPLSFYPNPVKDQMTIQFHSKGMVHIDIFNVLGEKVKSFSHEAAKPTISVADLENGMYFISVIENNTLYTRSFTKVN